MPIPIIFNGSIPEHYEEYLTPFLFDGFSADIVQRIAVRNTSKVLELAAGTGSVTKLLPDHLPATAQITATDLETAMLDVAKKNILASNITWAQVDMTNIVYKDNQFDSIVCQFGLMLVPEKLKALKEMHRVLRKGGQLVFSVWGNIIDNQVWNISGKVIESFLGINPILQDPGPFSLNETNTIQLLKEAGFDDVTTTVVNQTGSIATAAKAAKGFIEGLPVFMAISKKNPSMIPQILQTLEDELAKQLGNHPLQSPLRALVFETTK